MGHDPEKNKVATGSAAQRANRWRFRQFHGLASSYSSFVSINCPRITISFISEIVLDIQAKTIHQVFSVLLF